MSEEQTPGGGVRASDEDRERLVAELNEHAVAGRLSTEDFEQRVQAAYEATTTAQLAALRRDLPVSARQTQLDHIARRSHLTKRMIQESGGSLGLFVVCTGVWLASGASGQFWPVWVLVVFLITLVRNGWALYGPAPDLDAVERHLDGRREHRHDHRQRRVERRSDSRRSRDD